MLTLRIDNYGWQTSIALWVLVIGMTCTLRVIDVKYLLLVTPQKQDKAPEH